MSSLCPRKKGTMSLQCPRHVLFWAENEKKGERRRGDYRGEKKKEKKRTEKQSKKQKIKIKKKKTKQIKKRVFRAPAGRKVYLDGDWQFLWEFNLPLEGKGDRLRWMRCAIPIDLTANLTRSANCPPHQSATPPASPHRRSLTHSFPFCVLSFLLLDNVQQRQRQR